MMVELLMAITVMAIALTALVAVFSSGIISMGKSSGKSTATLLADAQMETFRAMVFRDIGLDLSDTTVAGLDSTYTGDGACANAETDQTCAVDEAQNTLTEPTGSFPTSCDQLDDWYPNTLPCEPSRVVDSTTTPASPDTHSYRIDTYVALAPAVTTGNAQRQAYKQVTIVVRDGKTLSLVLARETSNFVCAAATVPGDTADC